MLQCVLPAIQKKGGRKRERECGRRGEKNQEKEKGRKEGMERGEGQREREESMATNKNDTFVLSESAGYSL